MIVFPVLIPGQNFPGREITKCHGKGTEIWGMYSRESRETGIPAHPCHGGLPLHHLILVYPLCPSMSTCHGWLFSTLFSFNISLFNIQSEEICEHGEKVVLTAGCPPAPGCPISCSPPSSTQGFKHSELTPRANYGKPMDTAMAD